MSLKNSNDPIGNRTRDLPVCSVVHRVLIWTTLPQEFWSSMSHIGRKPCLFDDWTSATVTKLQPSRAWVQTCESICIIFLYFNNPTRALAASILSLRDQDTRISLWVHWTRHWPVTHGTHVPDGNRTLNSSKRTFTNLRLRPRGHPVCKLDNPIQNHTCKH